MKGLVSKLLFVLAIILSLGSVRSGFARLALQRHWRETDSETLWTNRYNNCDYGYYVLLPNGVVGHGTHSPSPNHGFRIPLPDVGATSYALDRNQRFIWVDASYNASDARSLADLVSDRGDEAVAKTVARKSTKMAGVPAIQITTESASRDITVVEVETVALRAGIIYTIGLRTPRTDAIGDEAEYRRIIQAFRLLKLPTGECSNG
jgi:hypothetical protein